MIRARPLMPEAFGQYGSVFSSPAQGRTAPAPVLDNLRSGARVMLGLNHLPPTPPICTMLERHLFSGQCFVTMSGSRLLLVVAPSDAAGQPVLAKVEAFLAGPGQAFDYRPGTWHAGLAALDVPAVVASLLCRDGSPADVEVITLASPIHVDLT